MAPCYGHATRPTPERPEQETKTITNTLLRALIRTFTLPLLPFVPITTFVLKCLMALPPLRFLYALVMSVISIPLLGSLIFMSRLWRKAPILRPILAAIGITLALLGYLLFSLTANPTRQDKMVKLAICDSFPFSHVAVG